jgi:putative methionyl-tRNA formyltransferase
MIEGENVHIVIVSNRRWNRRFIPEVEARTGAKVTYLEHPEDVSQENMMALSPDWVFFPHWSYIIPAEVYENFRCVIFHMTDLPFGRGGSPLQNLIVRGIYETKITALRCVKELDAGPVYTKHALSLWGSAEEIYLRAGEVTKEMMIELVQEEPVPYEQTGEGTVFKRRTPEDSDIGNLSSLSQVFDYIRMLDAEGYPAAFLQTNHLRMEFSRASLKDGCVLADVRIKVREEDDG